MTRQRKESSLVAESVLEVEDVELKDMPIFMPAMPEVDSVVDSDFEIKIDPPSLPSLNGYKLYTNGNQHADICYENLITEDDEPVDNIPFEKLQRLLVSALQDTDHLPRPFLAAANVGVFDDSRRPAIVPDMFLSLGVKIEGDIWKKENRSYFTWKYGKPPEIVLEVVSNTKGNEAGTKFGRYAALGVKYYVIVDYSHRVQDKTINVYELEDDQYVLRDDNQLPDVNLSLTFWEGEFEEFNALWVRWCTLEGDMLLTGRESMMLERERADQEQVRVKRAQERAAKAEQLAVKAQEQAAQDAERAELYLQKLREAGIEI